MMHFFRESKSLFRLVDSVMNGVDSWRQGPSLMFSDLAPNRPLAYRSIFSSHSFICPSIPGVMSSLGKGVIVAIAERGVAD